jgi:hypothetical protein
MRSPLRLAVALALIVVAAACGEVAPLAVDATPTCSPACGANATCTGTTCACDTGWEGDGLTCTDVNECMTDNGGCDPNAACFNTEGSRNCGCNTGYVGDGVTCRRVWEPRGNAQIRLTNVVNGQTNQAIATVAAGRIYFGPDMGSPGDPGRFMRYFDIASTSFNTDPLTIPPATQDDFCGCGYTEVFVGTPTEIFMLGNYGQRYNVATNQWSTIASYTGAFERGEAAGAYDSNNGNGLIYQIGGRGPLNTAQRLTLSTLGFGNEPGTLPFSVDSARAWVPAGTNVVYLAGGFASDNSRQHFLRHPTGTSTWTALPDAPIQLGSLTGMGDWQGKIWVTTRTQMVLFDIAANTWLPPISLPGGFAAAVTAGSRTFALVQINDTLEVQELMAIE